MREIVFRGKPINKCAYDWVYGYLFKSWDRAYICWGTTNGVPDMIEVIPETVGQFTGFYDKDNKKVFEGDIINIKEYVNLGIKSGFKNSELYELGEDVKGDLVYDYNSDVIYEDGCFVILDSNRKSHNHFLFAFKQEERYSTYPCVDISIIGNIYDNLYLLGDFNGN